MENQIKALRDEGKTYKEISQIVGCAKSTVAYYCGNGQKKKNTIRKQKYRRKIVISNKVAHFQCDRKLKDKSEDFQRERFLSEKGETRLGKRNISFRWRDVIFKYGWETNCYLTGRKIDLREPTTYQFDHKIPYSKGGTCTLENLGIACKEANLAKSDMMIDEFLLLCKEVLEHNGYEVRSVKPIGDGTVLETQRGASP